MILPKSCTCYNTARSLIKRKWSSQSKGTFLLLAQSKRSHLCSCVLPQIVWLDFFPNSFAATGNRTHVGCIAPLRGTLIQDALPTEQLQPKVTWKEQIVGKALISSIQSNSLKFVPSEQKKKIRKRFLSTRSILFFTFWPQFTSIFCYASNRWCYWIAFSLSLSPTCLLSHFLSIPADSQLSLSLPFHLILQPFSHFSHPSSLLLLPFIDFCHCKKIKEPFLMSRQSLWWWTPHQRKA